MALLVESAGAFLPCPQMPFSLGASSKLPCVPPLGWVTLPSPLPPPFAGRGPPRVRRVLPARGPDRHADPDPRRLRRLAAGVGPGAARRLHLPHVLRRRREQCCHAWRNFPPKVWRFVLFVARRRTLFAFFYSFSFTSLKKCLPFFFFFFFFFF